MGKLQNKLVICSGTRKCIAGCAHGGPHEHQGDACRAVWCGTAQHHVKCIEVEQSDLMVKCSAADACNRADCTHKIPHRGNACTSFDCSWNETVHLHARCIPTEQEAEPSRPTVRVIRIGVANGSDAEPRLGRKVDNQ